MTQTAKNTKAETVKATTAKAAPKATPKATTAKAAPKATAAPKAAPAKTESAKATTIEKAENTNIEIKGSNMTQTAQTAQAAPTTVAIEDTTVLVIGGVSYRKHPEHNVFVSENGEVLLTRTPSTWLQASPRKDEGDREFATVRLPDVVDGKARAIPVWQLLAETFNISKGDDQVFVVEGNGKTLSEVTVESADTENPNKLANVVGRNRAAYEPSDEEIVAFKDVNTKLTPLQRKHIDVLASKFEEQGIPFGYRKVSRCDGMSYAENWEHDKKVFDMIFVQKLTPTQVAKETGFSLSRVNQIQNLHSKSLDDKYLLWVTWVNEEKAKAEQAANVEQA